MDRVRCMQVFARVAQHAGFAAAARELRMSPAAVTKHVRALEAQLGARLFDRTTRRVGLTEAGRVYLEHCLECLQALEDAETALAELGRAPKGLLRITAPIDFGEHLLPVLEVLTRTHPGLALDLRLSNRVVDLVHEGVDVAVRVAPSLDGQYVARAIARTRLRVVAAPSYLKAHGRPRKPEDLARHRNLVFDEPRAMSLLSFARGRRKRSVRLAVSMTSNGGALLLSAARAGLGVAVMPSFLGQRDLVAGVIEPVLDDWRVVPELRVFAVYPHRRFLSPKVRAFLEALRATYGEGSDDPWWVDTVPHP